MRNSLSRVVGGVVSFFLFLMFVVITGINFLVALGALLAGFVAVGLLVKPGEARLEPDEKVVYPTVNPSGPPVWVRYAITLGLYEFWRKATRLTVTDRRVIYHAGLISKTERSLPLHFLQDASIHSVLGSQPGVVLHGGR